MSSLECGIKLTVNMGSAADVVSWEDSLKGHDAFLLARLDATKHGVIKLTIIADTVCVATRNSTVDTLILLVNQMKRWAWEALQCCCNATFLVGHLSGVYKY